MLRLLRAAAVKWKADRCDMMGAAIAYYSAFSLAPLVMLGVAVMSLRAGAQQSQRFMLGLLDALVGSRGADAMRPLVESAGRMKHGGWGTALGAATLLYGASTLFVHLQTALNLIWQAPALRRGWFRRYLKRRMLSAVLVGCVPLVLLFAPAWHARLGSLGRSQAVTVALSVALETLLFGIIFKVLPDVAVPWEDAWVGAVFTASLFTFGQTLLGYYFTRVAARSAYGAAGSIVALLIWLHVSAQILLFGAEFVHAYQQDRNGVGG
jgi:membrane protein